MKRITLRYFIINLFLLYFTNISLAQTSTSLAQNSPKTHLKEIISAVDTFTNRRAIEKIYLQTDKSAYNTGDTLWFKAYLFDANYANASIKSGVLYVEIANDSNTVLKRIMLPVFKGLTYGHIALDPESLPQGGYILRAYTNWMRNFEEDAIFKKDFYINNVTDGDWLINYNARIIRDAGKDKVQLNLKFNQFDNIPVGLREMQLQVADQRKAWFKSNVETTFDGLLNTNFEFPEKANPKNLTLNIQDLRKSGDHRKLQLPVCFNRPEYIDLQFMPEGGHLVANLPAHIAFKALNEDGTGAEISGSIYDSKAREVAAFHTTHKGMGTFNLIPQTGETYSAKIKLPDGHPSKAYTLPLINSTGITLKVDNQFQNDSCEIAIAATPDVAATGKTYFLMGQARGKVCYGASFNFNHNSSLKIAVNNKIFPSGIVRFTLCGPDKIPLTERIIYVDHADNLNIHLTENKASYLQRDAVSIHIKVSDQDGAPVQGSFSLAVTDDGQVKTDSITSSSIVTQMLLTASLKGNIEDPGYYEHATSAEKWRDLDQLLLTQGWVGYDWNDIFKPAKPFNYTAEPEFLVQGRVVNAFNKPVARSGVTLLSKRPLLILDTITNNNGTFVFKNIFPTDTAVFFIQAKNKRGKSFNVGIEMDEFKPPVFVAEQKHILPWYVNIDTANLTFMDHQIRLKKEQKRITGGNMLREVEIKAKKIIKDSKNLNGPGEADLIIGEEELGKAGRATLGDLLNQRVKGFGIRTSKSGKRFYSIYDMRAHIIIDGIDIEFSRPDGVPLDEYFKEYLDYYDAEEIKGIEVMRSGKYQMRYSSNFLDPMAKPFDHAFIEVTTRSGHGPFVKKSIGTYVYKPLPFTLPKKFYAPKYSPGSTADMTDIRSTVYWEPDIVTDKNGEATLTFYTADDPGNYSLILEGSNMDGNLGVKRASIAVKSH